MIERDVKGNLIVDGKKIGTKEMWHTVGDRTDWEWKRMSNKWKSWGCEVIDKYLREDNGK